MTLIGSNAIAQALSGIFGLLRRRWREALILSLAAALMVTRGTLADRTQQLQRTATAFQATVDAWRAGTELAKQMDALNAARVRSEQDAISKGIVDGYEARLADVRVRYDRLRGQSAASGAGGGGNTAVPGSGDATGRTGEAPGENGFPLDDALICTMQAIQLDALIDWVEAQAAVDMSGAGE